MRLVAEQLPGVLALGVEMLTVAGLVGDSQILAILPQLLVQPPFVGQLVFETLRLVAFDQTIQIGR